MEAPERKSSSSSSLHHPQPHNDDDGEEQHATTASPSRAAAKKKRNSKSVVVVLPKEERIDILSEAAELGRLTRLNEHVVEAVAGPRELESDFAVQEISSHKPPTGSIVLTSDFQIAIQEAAEQGKLRRLKPVVIENFRERTEQPDHVVSISHFNDDTRISKFLEEERQRKKLETPMERAERIKEAMEKVQTLEPMAISKPHVKANIPLRMREDVAKLAAQQSHDRTNRISNQDNELKVTFRCQCPHCQNASPFQTNFYKSLQKEQLQRIKSQRLVNRLSMSSRSILNIPPTLKEIVEEEDDDDEEEEEVDEKLLKLRKQVEASIMEDERRRQKEEEDRIKADKHANILAAKAILEKSLFQQPKPVRAESTRVETLDPDVLYSNTFGKAFAQVSKRIIKEYEMDEDEWNQKLLDDQMEQEDLRQLTELYDRQDDGEKVDEERIYELELFDRQRRDAYLSERELADLYIYTKRRKRTDMFIEEYEDVMNRLNNGEEIDEHRAYQLEYVVKKRGLSQDLTIAEESAMIQFETEEYLKDGLNPEDFKTSFGLEESDGDNDDENENEKDESEEENVSLNSRTSGQDSSSAADAKRDDPTTTTSIQKKPSNEDVPDAVESSDSDSADGSNGSSLSGEEENDGDDSSLSYYEKDELQDLTEYKEMGERIDMNRYLDLFLFDKWKKGEKLDEKEMVHLNTYRRRRKMERSYRLEFAKLVQLQATGQPYDEDRFYRLQLFARRQVGQPLNDKEMHDLQEFEKDEGKKEEERRRQRKAKSAAAAKDSDSFKGSDDAGSDDGSASSRDSNGNNETVQVVLDNGPSIFDHVSRQSYVMDQEAKAKKKYGKKSKTKLADSIDEDVGEEEDESGDEDDSMEGSQSDGSDQESNEDQSEGDESEAPHSEEKDQDKVPLSEAVKDHESNDDQSLKGEESEAPHPEQKDPDKGPSNETGKDESDESSFLSPDEFAEYLRLIEDKEKGLDVDEDRLQFLRLINMWQFGESMSVEQEFKLDGFRRKRRTARELKEEFATLLERSDKGEDVDEDRMYLLELFARKQIGEKLTEDEALDLRGLEEKEGLTDEEGELPAPAEVMHGDEGETVLHAVAISDDESLPSTGEIEELEELLQREANNEFIDQKRLYALQLLMKWQNGDGLDTTQRSDLAGLRYQRRKDRHYKNEFEELLAKGDQGSEVDEDRIYFLQLYARRLLGEQLSYDEVVDLERFESEETISFEKEEQIVPSNKEEAPVAAPMLEHTPQADEDSNHTVPDPWSMDIPTEETTNVEASKEAADEPDGKDGETALEPPIPEDSSEKSASNENENEIEAENTRHEQLPRDDAVEQDSKADDSTFETPMPEDSSEKSASNANDEEAENAYEDHPSDSEMEIAPPTLPETDGTPQTTSRDFAALNTVPDSDTVLQSTPAAFTALKDAEESASEQPLTRDHDASVAATVPAAAPPTLPETDSTPQTTSRDFAGLNTVPESIALQSMSADFAAVKNAEESTSEKPLTRDHDAGVATTVPATAPPTLPETDFTPQTTSRDFAGLNTVPESIALQSMSADFAALKKAEESTSEKLLARDHDASIATTVPVTEESSQNELQSTDERSAFPSSVIEVIHESLSQKTDEGRSTLDDHPPRSDWKDKESAIPEPIMAAMEANANLLKELDAARLATHEARERAGQEAAKRAAAEDNAKYAESEAFRAKVALVTAEQQQRRNYVEPVYQMRRDIQVTGSREISSNVPESYLSVMAFNTKLLEQLNDTRQAALEATEQANKEAVKRAAAEESAKKAAHDAIFARQALTADRKRELHFAQKKEISSEILKPYMAAMDANAKLLEQLDEARKEALRAKTRATEEALKRAAAEENAKRAAMEAEKATIMLLERGQSPHDLVMDPWSADPVFNLEIAGLPDHLFPTSQEPAAEKYRFSEMDLETRAQERRERALKVVAERRRRDAEQAEARTEAEAMEREHREQVRRAVEERKRKKRAAMEARKQQTIERAMQGMNSLMITSNGDEALQAAKRAKELLQAKRARAEASAPGDSSNQENTFRPIPTNSFDHLNDNSNQENIIKPAPTNSFDHLNDNSNQENIIKPAPTNSFDHLKDNSDQENTIKRVPTDSFDHLRDSSNHGSSIKPVPTNSFDHIKSRLEPSAGEDDDHNDPPVRSSNDPPGTAVGESRSGANRPLHRDPSGDALRGETLVGKVIAKDPSEAKNDADRDEITHEDWYSKMEKIAMSHTAEHGQDDVPQQGSNISPEEWYQEIEALSRDSEGEEANVDSDMKRAIEEAQRKARATNMETDDEVEKEMSEDVEAIRRKVMKMSKDEAVNQILLQVSSDAKSTLRQDSNIGRPSAFDPDLEPSTGEDANYTVGAMSEGSSVSGVGFELRSQQASYQKSDPINKSYRSTPSRASRRSAPLRKEKNQISSAPPVRTRKPAGRTKPNRMKNISWRSNPKDSFSDWKVEIKHKETGKVDVYHLHRNILGYGARKSEYFALQFQEDRVVNGYYETKSPKVTQLDLPEAWADMFPMVLDFLYYNREKTLKMTAHRSCAMYKWAEFLGIPALKNTIVDFYEKNISLKNFGRFMASAVQMKAAPLVVASKRKVGGLVTQQPNQAWRLAPQFLVTVLEANRKELIGKAGKNKKVQPQAFQNASCKWSKAIYYCVSRNKKQVTHKIFADLTTETAIPVIDSTVALGLLILDVELRAPATDDAKKEYSKNNLLFQKRCVQSIVQNWDSFRLKYPNQQALTSALQKLPSDVLTEILILSNNRNKSNPQTAI